MKRPRHEQHRGRLGLARPGRVQHTRLPREQTLEHVPAIADLLEDRVGERRIPQPDQFLRRRTGSGRSTTASTSVKTVYRPPIPQASASKAANVSPGGTPELPQRKAQIVRHLVQCRYIAPSVTRFRCEMRDRGVAEAKVVPNAPGRGRPTDRSRHRNAAAAPSDCERDRPGIGPGAVKTDGVGDPAMSAVTDMNFLRTRRLSNGREGVRIDKYTAC